MLQPAIGPILRDRKSRIGAADITDQSQSTHSQLRKIQTRAKGTRALDAFAQV